MHSCLSAITTLVLPFIVGLIFLYVTGIFTTKVCAQRKGTLDSVACMRIPRLARLAQLLVNAEQKCQKQCYIAEIFVPRDLRRNNSPLA